MNYYEDNWIMSDAGNWCLILERILVATVFCKDEPGRYGAAINCPDTGTAYFFPGRITDIEIGKSIVENAFDGGIYQNPPWRPQQNGWQRSKKAGNLYLRANGGIFAIKRASSGSYYVVTQDARWACPRTGCQWFDSESDAQFAVDRAITEDDETEYELELDIDCIDFD